MGRIAESLCNATMQLPLKVRKSVPKCGCFEQKVKVRTKRAPKRLLRLEKVMKTMENHGKTMENHRFRAFRAAFRVVSRRFRSRRREPDTAFTLDGRCSILRADQKDLETARASSRIHVYRHSTCALGIYNIQCIRSHIDMIYQIRCIYT